jgi:hypothetical protein
VRSSSRTLRHVADFPVPPLSIEGVVKIKRSLTIPGQLRKNVGEDQVPLAQPALNLQFGARCQ